MKRSLSVIATVVAAIVVIVFEVLVWKEFSPFVTEETVLRGSLLGILLLLAPTLVTSLFLVKHRLHRLEESMNRTSEVVARMNYRAENSALAEELFPPDEDTLRGIEEDLAEWQREKTGEVPVPQGRA
jgi:hypothetical protein